MKIITIVLMLSAVTSTLLAQTNKIGCDAPEQSQFDFWIGNWNCRWNDSIRGTDHITRQMDECVVQENYSDLKNEHKGWSWTVHNSTTRLWQQTFVSNNGEYLLLNGGMRGDSMILTTEEKKTQSGKLATFRILFCNITQDHFDWSWDVSFDHSQSWKPLWKISYERVTS